MGKSTFRSVLAGAGVLAVWTAIVIKWGEVAELWIPDDPGDPGAVMAAQYGGTIFAALIWLVGLAFITVVSVWMYILVQQIRR